MKTSARFLAVILAVLMIAGAAITVSAFSDVEEGYEYAPAISILTQLGVISGYEDGTFKPENPVERDEMAKLVYVLYTTFEKAGSGTVKFTDVAANNWAAGYISWCAAKSIVGGYGNGEFKPDNNVTYDEALKMVCATLGYTDFDSNLWPTDVRQKGLKDLKLGKDIDAEGGDALTRGEVAQLLYNALFAEMNETKVDYVIDKSYYKPDGSQAEVKVPVEVAKTLAADVWSFTKQVVRVVGTKNYKLTGFNKSDDDKAINVSVNGVETSVKLATYGLEEYEKNTDALIGLDIMTVKKDGKTVADATVLGSVKLAKVGITGSDEAGKPYTDEVKIDGVVYDDTEDSDYLLANLKALTFTDVAGTVTVSTSAFTVDTVNNGETAELEYPHIALVMDQNGDGVVDAIAVDYIKLGKVTKVENVKATSTKAAYTKYYYAADIAATTSNTYITSDKIADGKTLAKGDVFVYGTINGVTYIEEVLAPVTAAATKITTGKGAAITLADVGAVSYVDGENGDTYLLNAGTAITFDAKVLLDKDTKAQDYYVYNNFVIAATAATTVADSYDLALLLYVKDPTDPKYNEETKKIEIFYPAVLLIDGKEVTVNLKAIDSTVATVDGNGVYSLASYKIGTDLNGFATYSYTLVNYTVDAETGLYTLKTTATDLGDTVVVADAKEIKLNTNTGLYTIDGKVFELDDKSVIYYTYDNTDTDATDTYKYLGTYTAANILKKFAPATTAQETYLLKNADGTYTLLATVLAAKLEAPAEVQERTYKNDARLIKYCAETSAAESVDGVAYYSYLFLDMETMKNGSQVVDTTLSIDKLATKAVAGNFYGWDADAKKYVKVTTANESVKIAKITNVDAARGIIYLNGASYAVNNETVDYADGVKIADSVKIWGTAGNNKYTYTTFTVETLAELFELYNDTFNTDEDASNDTYLEAAVGTYFDEDGNLCIAWIVVENYYYVTSNDTEVLTKTSDIIGALK